MKAQSELFVLVAALRTAMSHADALSRHSCTLTFHESTNCAGEEVGEPIVDILYDWIESPCGTHYNDTSFECCVDPSGFSKYEVVVPANATGARLSCEQDTAVSDAVIWLSLVAVMALLILVGWCCLRCYGRSKQALADRQSVEDQLDEEATLPDDDSVSLTSIA